LRKREVYKIARKYGFINKNMSRRDFGWIKNFFLWPGTTWRQYLDTIFLSRYLDNENPLPEEGIYIKELNMQLGGTVTVELR